MTLAVRADLPGGAHNSGEVERYSHLAERLSRTPIAAVALPSLVAVDCGGSGYWFEVDDDGRRLARHEVQHLLRLRYGLSAAEVDEQVQTAVDSYASRPVTA